MTYAWLTNPPSHNSLSQKTQASQSYVHVIQENVSFSFSVNSFTYSSCCKYYEIAPFDLNFIQNFFAEFRNFIDSLTIHITCSFSRTSQIRLIDNLLNDKTLFVWVYQNPDLNFEIYQVLYNIQIKRVG